MDVERFRKSPAGHLVRTLHGEIAYWAFVPAPLPPQLSLDVELVRILSEADRALGELAGLGRIIPNPHLLIRPFIRREAVLSSRIEGTEADITDLYAYEAGQGILPGLKPSGPASDVREVSNYVWALEYGLERLSTLPVSLRLIRELHARLRGCVASMALRASSARAKTGLGFQAARSMTQSLSLRRCQRCMSPLAS